MKPLPAGPKGHLITGVLRDYRRDPLGFFTSCTRAYGDLVPLRFGPVRAFLLNHPDYIDEVLVTQYRNFVKGSPGLRNNRLVFGNGLLTSEGEFWRHQRRLVQPAFHRDRIASYAQTMVECAARRMAHWQDDETRDMHVELMRITMEIAAQTLFGAGVEQGAEEIAACMNVLQEGAMHRFNSLLPIPEWVPTPTHLRLRRAISVLDKVVYRFIDSRRRSTEDEGDLLYALLHATDEEDGSRMTDRQLRDEVLTLFLAGHETTALALTWTLMLLARHPEVERRLAEEIGTILQGRHPTFEDRARLTYTEYVVLEAMRLYPPAWALSRTAIRECDIGGHRVPAGSLILILPWVMHRHPRYFETADAFIPDRWEGDLAKRLPRHVYLPFGGGPRTCIGNSFSMLEAVLLLATLCRDVRFQLVPDHPIVLQPAVTLRPRYGIRMILCRR